LFATAELKLFSTILRGRAIDLFFDSGIAAGACALYGNRNQASSRASIFFNLGGSVAFESHFCASHDEIVAS
jgi:hypothetical protein